MLILVLILAVILAGVFIHLFRIAPAATGYKAKILASTWFVCGREVDPARAPEIAADYYKLLRLFRATVDRGNRSVTVSFLGLRHSRAFFRPGFGTALSEVPPAPSPELPAPSRPDPSEPWPAGDAPGPETPKALRAVLERAFSTQDPRRRTRAVLIAREGRLLTERYAPGFSAATPFPGWSMTKSAVAALVGVLVGEGKLSMDERRLLPEWCGAADPRGAILLEDLLRMRSGLTFAETYADPFSDVVQMLYVQPDMASFAAAKPLRAPPGTVWKYSSGTTNILSKILRETLGDPAYREFPRKALFEPLGMSSAVFETDAAGTFVGSSYLFASARDWLRLGQLHLQDGLWQGRRLLPEGWTKLIATPTPQSKDRRYGAHWWVRLPKDMGGDTEAARRLPADAYHALGHEGQCLTVIPSRGLVLLRLGLSIVTTAWDHAAFLDEALPALKE